MENFLLVMWPWKKCRFWVFGEKQGEIFGSPKEKTTVEKTYLTEKFSFLVMWPWKKAKRNGRNFWIAIGKKIIWRKIFIFGHVTLKKLRILCFWKCIWFWYKWRRRTPAISETASNITILHVVYKAGLFHILFGMI